MDRHSPVCSDQRGAGGVLRGAHDAAVGHADEHLVLREPQAQRVGRVAGDERALVEDAHAVAEALGFGHVVRGEEHGGAVVVQLVQHSVHLGARGGVEAARGLVEEQQLGPVHDRRQQRRALAHALRAVLDERLLVRGQVHALEQRGDVVTRHAAHLRVEAQVLLDGHALVEGARVREDADALVVVVRGVLDGAPEQHDAAGILDELAREQLDGGGLAGARGA